MHVGFVLLEHFSMTAFTAAVDALVTANLVSSEPLFKVSSYAMGNTCVRSDLGIDITATHTLDQLKFEGAEKLDVIVVCGGYRCALGKYASLNSYLKQADKQQLVIGGLWNGSIHLAHAQLLDNQPCALHPDNHAFMREHFPRVQLSDQVLVSANKRLTSAGPNSALEMMLVLITQLDRRDIVRAIREILSCDQVSQGSDNRLVKHVDNPSFPELLRDVLQLMNTNIEEPLSVEELARCINVSRRRIERLFQTYLETTPSRYYLQLRITQARRLLLQSDTSISNIALACGFLSSTHFSHCFKDYFGISPSQARQKVRS